ncbi:hypothetical protein GAR96_13115 [Salmonella enterica]|uniref:Two-component-system connector protein AriR n=1 Tax=Salmonella enterica TaxID=28901 RepID=A0A763CD65_SALER|nr:hypothetical protein [Salmonella enterica subsp. enterica]EAO3205831.1 hypothetical protein [Salmonella enterica]EBU8196128.1 hypothetical protein [Salmonella enterica subsp. enterica serovar Sandiego]EDD3984427.1 hypothetical protein [Salmonella enterica subsp. enterica serovar Panama]EKR1728224.1 hypothetical protein [Salmonella enterica subsp. enterica serovar Madelia]
MSFKRTVSFSYNDSLRGEEIIAIKTFLLAIIKNVPHETSIAILKSLKDSRENAATAKLYDEILAGIIALSTPDESDQ